MAAVYGILAVPNLRGPAPRTARGSEGTPLRNRAVVWTLALLASLVVTAAYHLGYREFPSLPWPGRSSATPW